MPNESELHERFIELAERIRRGDSLAEDEFAASYSVALRALLRGFTADRSLLDDLQQDVFLVLLRRLRSGTLSDPSAIDAFAFGTAAYLIRNRRRRDSRRPIDSDLAGVEVADSRPTPLALVLEIEREVILRDALRHLRSVQARRWA